MTFAKAVASISFEPRRVGRSSRVEGAAPIVVLALAAATIGCGDREREGQGTLSDVAAPTLGTELIANGNFEQGFAPWDTYLENPDNASYAVEAGEAVVDVHPVAIDLGGIQLKYTTGLNLHRDRTYRLTFRARATPDRTILTSIWENGHDLDNNGFMWSSHQWNEFALTSIMTDYAVQWVMPVTNEDAGLCFFMTAEPDAEVTIEPGEVVFDDVSLVALD